ncbi:hypothetical protein [Phosphitispora fastidiosa]|uniref:hypothetical protein n=1 Tax=Phosphitispora fastidiosa TaxID=2837202 RepID=UPI001E4B1B2F|nr:hypothetical protein [Phosphitispora fastidiosa]MBU7008120.1 hypothetical protein [Phosphitispora fastidiosa]
MYTDGRHFRFKVVIVLAVLNSIITFAYFVLINQGVVEAAYLPENIWAVVLPLAVIAVAPVIIGSYGLYMRRMWGLGFFTLGGGGFLFASLAGMMLSVRSNVFGILFFLSLYLILYNAVANIYIWIFRFNLKDF